MLDKLATNPNTTKLRIGFWLIVLAIPTLSFTGRKLQHWVQSAISRQDLGWIVIFLLVASITVYLARHIGNWRRLVWRLAGITLPFFLILHYVPLYEEKMHFIMFGLLGYITAMIHPPLRGVLICIFFSIGDELFQWALPDRVGDIRDVIFNASACAIGMLLAFSDREPK